MYKYLIGFLFFATFTDAQTISIDGNFDDWSEIEPVFVDQLNDGQSNGIDFERIWVHNDQFAVYFRFELNREIKLQENNELAIYIDFDDDINTGFKINGIGAEVRYFFGERFGIVSENGQNEFINFSPVSMLVAPSVSSTQFEVSFARSVDIGSIDFTLEDQFTFRIEDNSFNGDEVPNDLSGVPFSLLDNQVEEPALMFDKPSNAEFRFLTYNIENDQLFDASREDEFRRIFQALNPDIIALQEVRDFGTDQTKAKIESFLPGEWYAKKHGFDIVTVSRYPIKYSEFVDGNAAYYIDVNGREILMINCHLPCCENDFDRQQEVDYIMEYVREVKAGNSDYALPEGSPIIIAGDMNFVGDSNQPYTFETGDIFNNSNYGPDFAPDWDGSTLQDVDGTASGTYTNFTWYNPFGSFFPGKLDWIFYTDSQIKLENSFNVWTPALSNSELDAIGLNRFDELNAADHLPTVADFSFLTVSTDDFVELDVTLYPNPVENNLFIHAKKSKIQSAKILTIEGKVVAQKIFSSESLHQLDMSALPSGQYYILLEGKKGRSIEKVSKI